jgi:hypothetical protein
MIDPAVTALNRRKYICVRLMAMISNPEAKAQIQRLRWFRIKPSIRNNRSGMKTTYPRP